jgi:VIT1/CCC1 family predicted Fe2+/Mn2+ transporter
MNEPFQKSAILTGATFVCIGYIRGHVTKKHKLKTALETFLIGSTAALISYLVGSIFSI